MRHKATAWQLARNQVAAKTVALYTFKLDRGLRSPSRALQTIARAALRIMHRSEFAAA